MAAIDYRDVENHMVTGNYLYPAEHPDPSDWDDTDDTKEVDG